MNPVYQNIFTLTKAAIFCQTPEALHTPADWVQQIDLSEYAFYHFLFTVGTFHGPFLLFLNHSIVRI